MIPHLDLSVTSPLNVMLRAELDNYLDQEEKQGKTAWTTSERCEMTTICVWYDWESFCLETPHTAQQCFCDLVPAFLQTKEVMMNPLSKGYLWNIEVSLKLKLF